MSRPPDLKKLPPGANIAVFPAIVQFRIVNGANDCMMIAVSPFFTKAQLSIVPVKFEPGNVVSPPWMFPMNRLPCNSMTNAPVDPPGPQLIPLRIIVDEIAVDDAQESVR